MDTRHWKPGTDYDVLLARARLNREIRAFFEARSVLEVETPVLGAATVTDINLESLRSSCQVAGVVEDRFLQTSPEYAMKRLLCAGSGPIYQISKAFRDAETGRFHNPEFTLLEWYRPGYDQHQLMDELDALIQRLGLPAAQKSTYRDVMTLHAGLDPATVTIASLSAQARALGVQDEGLGLSADDYLDLILTHTVQPGLGLGATFIYDYPATQAALARIRPGNPPLAERFELFIDGVEVANGYHELTDPVEQRERFAQDLEQRRQRGLPTPPVDERFLSALEAGLPPCAGVAVGLDRILMIATGKTSLEEVLTFSGTSL